MGLDAETERLAEDDSRTKNWKRWGTYLSERQWATVREDYSEFGECWTYLPHDHARSRAYRWGEDGLLGWTDRECRLCFAPALWNGRDPILKERLFGLGGPEGNHGEDVKEAYFFLDATPTHSYAKALYKYPHAEFPYAWLVGENGRRGRDQPEFELEETGVFDDNRYLDVFVEYAKAAPDDTLIRLTLANRGPQAVTTHLLPTLWFRNSWSWGREGGKYWPKPRLTRGEGDERAACRLVADHATLGRFELLAETAPREVLFTDNETNAQRLFGAANANPYVKDAFHEAVIHGRGEAVNPAGEGTKAALHYVLEVPAGGEVTVCLRLVAAPAALETAAAALETAAAGEAPFGAPFEAVFAARRGEADAFYAAHWRPELDEDERRIVRQANAGLPNPG